MGDRLVIGGKHLRIKMHVVTGDGPCLYSKGWLKEHGAVIVTQAGELRLTQQQITAAGFWRGSEP